jgi:adenosylcobinamide-phosphate synthase
VVRLRIRLDGWRAANSTGAALGVLADRVLGEAGLTPHPVALFGRLMRGLEGVIYRDSRIRGVLQAAAGTALGAAAGWTVRSTTASTYIGVAGRGLRLAAGDVAVALEAGDLPGARARLPALVGRDPGGLDEGEIARAVVESVAENTVDAMVAPAMWAALAGGPGVLGYRAINTLDAMIGHRSTRYRRYGWASARLDDVAGWLPARLTAVLVAFVRPRSAVAVWRSVRIDAAGHPSPNAGVAEAAFAAALGLRLGGVNRYGERVEVRPRLGSGRPAEPADIERAVKLSSDVSRALVVVLVVAGGASR